MRGLWCVAIAAVFVAGCRDPQDVVAVDAAPRVDASGSGPGGGGGTIGAPDTLEIATWNIENFPARESTPATVAALIQELDLDVIVAEEIASETAWLALMAALPAYEGVLSTHKYNQTDYQKIGVIYRKSMITAGTPTLLFTGDSYAFPRPPLALPLTIDDGVHPARTIQVIGVHLKAGVAVEDGERRALAFAALDSYLRAQIASGGETEVVLAGDYNEAITTAAGQANFAPLLEAPDRYTVHTRAPATAGEISYIPFPRLIDHVTTTTALALPGARVVIPRLDRSVTGYLAGVSDHVPVVLVAPL